MGVFERFLSLWVALAIVAGVALGVWLPSVFKTMAAMEIAHVNLPVALLIWLMICRAKWSKRLRKAYRSKNVRSYAPR